jgi:hypothetical protein
MTDRDVEVLVRETFRNHEDLVGDAVTRLLPGVRARRRRRITIRSAAVGLAAVAAIGGTAVTVNLLPTAGPSPVPSASASQGTVPPGWRVEGAAGVEVAVPADWAVNDYGCAMSDRPSYVLNSGSPALCATEEPPNKQIAQIWTPPLTVTDLAMWTEYRGLAQREVIVNGVPAIRAEGLLADGRYGGWIWLGPGRATVFTKTLDPTVGRQILDSVRLVDGVDSVGCSIRVPSPASPPAGARPTFVIPEPTAISICHYGVGEPAGTPQRTILLDASARITGTDARNLAALLNAAPAGRNQDAPADKCVEERPLPQAADVVLHLWVGDEIVDNVWVIYSSCTNRGLDNGARQAQISHTLLRAIRDHVHAGYHLRADIPE